MFIFLLYGIIVTSGGIIIMAPRIGLIQLAARVAQNSTMTHKLGAVLIKGGSVINVGFNQSSTHRFARKFGKYYTRHAELNCILGVPRHKTTGATIYVIRVKKDGSYGMAKPCQCCEDMLMFVGVKKVYWSDVDGNIKERRL